MTDQDALPRISFARSHERRTEERTDVADHRRVERRCPEVGWIPLVRGVDFEAVLGALGECEILLMPAGAALLHPGEPNHDVFILLSGELCAWLGAPASPDSAIAITRGECVGELSAIDGKPASALVRAQTDARVLRVPREVFWHGLMALPGVAGNLMLALAERMRRTNEITLAAQREQLELVHLRKELDLARDLQASMLPSHHPMFPGRDDIDVCGLMEAASKVGGDFFEAFLVDDRRLFFCIGDVSGHGIAAAIFMARTLGLLRILAANAADPHGVLAGLNDRLSVGNETNLFVTLFCGFLDLETGTLRYSNAGHCPPLVSTGGRFAPLVVPRGPLVGALPGAGYSTLVREMAPGDILFCFTDGVTEAEDYGGREFSTQRVLALLDGTGPNRGQ